MPLITGRLALAALAFLLVFTTAFARLCELYDSGEYDPFSHSGQYEAPNVAFVTARSAGLTELD